MTKSTLDAEAIRNELQVWFVVERVVDAPLTQAE